MQLLKGRPVADSIDDSIRNILEGRQAKLVVYLIGADPSSLIYARSKIRKGEKLGVDVVLREFGGDQDEDTLVRSIMKDSSDRSVNGIMIERPLPGHLDMEYLMEHIPVEKDVEGLHPGNLGRLYLGKPYLIPPTPLGALFMLLHYGIEVEGRRVLVIGRSPNVGRPLATLLSMKSDYGNGTVTLAHSRTRGLSDITSVSDLVLTAVGKTGLVKGEMVRDGTVLIDLGINPNPDGSITGDVDVDSMKEMDVRVSPTPGGTGPVTVSSMFLNVAISSYRTDHSKLSENTPGIIRKIYQ